jgi:hypothetical protein
MEDMTWNPPCINPTNQTLFIYLLIILFPVEPSFLIEDVNDYGNVGNKSRIGMHWHCKLIDDRVGEYADLGIELYAVFSRLSFIAGNPYRAIHDVAIEKEYLLHEHDE